MAKEREVNIVIDAKNKAKGAFIEVSRGLKDLGEQSKSGLGVLSNSFDKADKVVYSFADRMQWMDKVAKRTFQGTAAAAGVYIGATLRDFSQLNDGIAKVNTLYDQTSESQKKMYQDSIKIFGMIPTNYDKLTQGIYDTISAGGDPEYATMFGRRFGMAGVAGDADMDVVTKAAMGTMNAFKLEARDLNKILDLQFMTLKDGITSYDELASSLGTGVLASAEGAGITLEELHGSIAMITKNAIPAAIATTSLNQMFNKFTDTKVIKEFKNFGVQIQDAKKNTRPLIEIFKDLNYQFDKRKMTGEQRKGFLKELVGSEQAARAITPLLSDIKEFERILGNMDKSSGAMRGAYDDRIESMKTQIQMFWNNLKATGIEHLYTLEPLMDTFMEPIMKKQKIEMDIQDLRDQVEFTESPKAKENLNRVIVQMEASLDRIEMPSVDDFKDALSESVIELNKLNPLLADIVDTVGNFLLKFVGEEGKENRNTAMKVGAGLFATQTVSWGFRKFKDIFGKTPWEIGKWAVPKGASLGKDVGETMYLKGLYAKDALTLPTNLTNAMYIPKGYEVGGKEFDKFRNRFLEVNNKESNNKGKIHNQQINPSVLNIKLTDELLKMWKLDDKINNNINMESKIEVDPKIDVNTRIFIDGKNIPIQKQEMDYKKVDKHSEVQARRYGKANIMLY